MHPRKAARHLTVGSIQKRLHGQEDGGRRTLHILYSSLPYWRREMTARHSGVYVNVYVQKKVLIFALVKKVDAFLGHTVEDAVRLSD